MITTSPTKAAATVQTPKQRCPSCNDDRVSRSLEDYEYVFGVGEEAIRLWLVIPVYRCTQCQVQFTNWEKEEIQIQALCKHFGVLNPNEIRQIRKKYAMSRSEFSQLTGIGEASLSRWENGINIQNIANDRYLRLLNKPATFRLLESIVSNIEEKDHQPKENNLKFTNIPGKKLKNIQVDCENFRLARES